MTDAITGGEFFGGWVLMIFRKVYIYTYNIHVFLFRFPVRLSLWKARRAVVDESYHLYLQR